MHDYSIKSLAVGGTWELEEDGDAVHDGAHAADGDKSAEKNKKHKNKEQKKAEETYRMISLKKKDISEVTSSFLFL